MGRWGIGVETSSKKSLIRESEYSVSTSRVVWVEFEEV